jgi:hypothetical protein
MHDDIDFVAVTGEGFVNTVIDDFVDKMMQPALGGIADVHGGTQANGFETFQGPDTVYIVILFALRRCRFVCHLA